MKRPLLASLRMALATIILTGVAYPLAVWAVGAVAFPDQTSGSLIERGGEVIGSHLIGQAFAGDRYFHSRPSAAGDGYDATASGPSNLGPTSKALFEAVTERVAEVQLAEAVGPGDVPVDLVTASASGLDPHITPDAAYLQAARVARVRGLTEVEVRALVASHIAGRQLGFLGEPRVNVLELNIALDALDGGGR